MNKTTLKEVNSHQYIPIICIVTLSAIIEYVFNMQLARVLSPDEYGNISVALSLAMFWSIVAELGGARFIQNYLPEYHETGKPKFAKGVLSFYVYACITVGLTIAILATVFAYVDINYLHEPDSNRYHPVILALWLLPVIGICSLFSAALKSFRHYVISSLPNLVLIYALAILILWAWEGLGLRFTDWYALALFGMTYLIICGLQSYIVYRYVPKAILSSESHYKPAEWMSLSIPLMLSTLFFVGQRQIDLIFVELLDPSEYTVGYFAAAQKVSGLVLICYLAINIVYIPLVSGILAKGKKEVRLFIARVTKKIFYTCFPVLILVIIFGKFLLGLFGPNYVVAYWPALMLGIGNFINAMLGYHIFLLQYSNDQNKVLFIQFSFLLVDATLNCVFIPIWGIVGAGVATTITTVSMSIVIALISMKKFDMTSFKHG